MTITYSSHQVRVDVMKTSSTFIISRMLYVENELLKDS